ncbi:unnamed protein product, partial [Owenia fusiformis]
RFGKMGDNIDMHHLPGIDPETMHYTRQPHPSTDPVAEAEAGILTQVKASSPRHHQIEQLQRFAGLGIGLASVLAENVLSHPCIVLRRQCQVNPSSSWYHNTPFTLFHIIYNIQRNQSVTTLFKGIGSTFMVRGIFVVSEAGISEFTPFPREVNRHSSVKKLLQHMVLKGLSFLATTPFYAASLVETVQSEIASERPGVFDCIKEGFGRLLGSWSTPQSTRLLPVWKLVVPTVCYGLMHYAITSIAQYTVILTVRSESHTTKGAEQTVPPAKSMYERYYPELIATFTGHLFADVILYPLENVVHRLHLQGTRTIIDNTDTGLGVVPIITRYEGMLDCFKCIILDEGLSGLYKGMGALVLQYTMHVMILKVTRFLFEQLTKDLHGNEDNETMPRRSRSSQSQM